MKKIFSILQVCITLVLCCINICFGEDSNSKQITIYYKDSPQALCIQISSQIEKHEQKYPLSLEEKSKLPGYVFGLSKLDGKSRADRVSKIREIGSGAIPSISKILSSECESDRKNALSALSLFVLPHEYITKDYEQTEELLISIIERTLYDKSSKIRFSAVGLLSSIAKERYPKIPEGIVTKLKDTMKNDPDEDVRLFTNHRLQDLGVLPRDPNRKIIID